MEDPNTLKERLAKLMQEQTSLKDERDEIQEPLTAAEIKRQEAYSEKRIREVELNKLKNTAKQQMEYVKTVNIVGIYLCLSFSITTQNAFHALMWIRQNADKFKNAVYGPIFNEVRFANSLHAQWFENCISRTILLSFVTQCKEDYDLLLTEVRDRQGIPINCLIADVGIIEYFLSQDEMK